MDHDKIKKKNGIYIGETKIETNTLQLLHWHKNITIIDISNRKITNFDDNTKLPSNLVELNLSHNQLVEVPNLVLKLENLKILDLSFNNIKYFDDTPCFFQTIEYLNLHKNNLCGPPYWIWLETPKNLTRLTLSCNINITNSLTDNYLEELIQYPTLVSQVDMYNCRLGKHRKFLASFSKAKDLNLGLVDYSYYNANYIAEIPFSGIDKCCDIERLNLCNTYIHTVHPTIDTFINLKEINLSYNNINRLPIEFCNLCKLEVCVLSFNKLLYLPENICKLEKLINLQLASNELCMVPETLFELKDLKLLDLYDNHLSEIQNNIIIEELDLAQNYFTEPEDVEYLEKRERIRLLHTDRLDGRKNEVIRSESEHSPCTTDDELSTLNDNNMMDQEPPKLMDDPRSSPEDWDSDDYWVPRSYNRDPTQPPHSLWLHFVKRKMSEGNFCPIDAHPVSVAEKVRYEKMCNPRECYESDGQFDDFSSDDS